jgi:hypothetical protein
MMWRLDEDENVEFWVSYSDGEGLCDRGFYIGMFGIMVWPLRYWKRRTLRDCLRAIISSHKRTS